jgi:hypothetical protein
MNPIGAARTAFKVGRIFTRKQVAPIAAPFGWKRATADVGLSFGGGIAFAKAKPDADTKTAIGVNSTLSAITGAAFAKGGALTRGRFALTNALSSAVIVGGRRALSSNPKSKSAQPPTAPHQDQSRLEVVGTKTASNGAVREGGPPHHADAGGTGRVREHQRMTANGKVSTVHEHAARRLHA